MANLKQGIKDMAEEIPASTTKWWVLDTNCF